MLSSYPKLVWCDIRKEFITCFATLTTACSFGVGVWVYSLVSSPFPNTYLCKCVFTIKKKKKRKKKKRYLVLSSRPTLVMCDSENGFISCSATLIASCSFGVVLWVCSIVSSPFPYIICFCVCLTKKKRKKKILSVVKLSHFGNVWYWEEANHLLLDINCSRQYWCWHVSAFPCLIHLPRSIVCVCLCVK